MLGLVGRTHVQNHRDIRADCALDVQHLLGREVVRGAVNVAADHHPLVRDLADRRQAEHLISPAVGEDGAIPAHQPAQAPGRLEDFRSGTQIQVIRVCQNQAEADVPDLLGGHGFDRALSCDGHEGGRLDDAVRGGQAAAARRTGWVPRCHFESARAALRVELRLIRR